MTSPKHVIGILGGMGPAASADFYHRIVNIAQHEFKADQDTDFPAMHLYNLPLTGFDETGFVDPERVAEQLTGGVQKLEAAGSDFIVIPCNTVHAFIERMRNAVSIPIISIVESVVDAAAARGLNTVGVLTSQSTRNYQLYESALSKRGITALSATDEEQRALNAIIHHVMSDTQSTEDAATLSAIAERFKTEGAGAVILGCTELPLAVQGAKWSLPIIDSADVLAHAALSRAYGSQS